ncbi:MAG: ComEC/Rec2 family competence protein [Victivallales bacterium]|nr:ComEC/Rec2 family competence protein [Victivallales bacterium]
MTDKIRKFRDLLNLIAGIFQKMTVKYPSFLILLGMLSVLVPLINEEYIYCVVVVLPLALCAGNRKASLRVLLGVVIGIPAYLVEQYIPPGHYARELGRADCGAEIKVEVVDASCTGDTLEWLPNPNLVFCQVKELRYTAHDQWRRASGKLAVRLPEETGHLNYGDKLYLSGAFMEPLSDGTLETYTLKDGETKLESVSELNSFDFQNYLRARSIYRVFDASEISVEGRRKTFTGTVLYIRDLMLRQLCRGVQSDNVKRLLAALTSGCKQGMDQESRQSFIRTGTIHIFTVSGFHVGILALTVFWLLRWLPFRLRHFMVPGIIFLYVLSTGMNPPAVRTLIMLTIWCFCRGMLFRTPGLNIIYLAAAVILAYNPFYIKDLGFQYSFIVVSFLVASIETVRRWLTLPGEYFRWIPSGYRSRAALTGNRLVTMLLSALLGCTIAWLASSGVGLLYQGFYFPQAVWLNFLIIPFVWLIFLRGAAKLLLTPLSFLQDILGQGLEYLMGTMSAFCEFFYESFSIIRLPAPGIWIMAAFYGALILLLAANRAWMFRVGVMLLAGTFMVWHLKTEFIPPSLAVFYGGYEELPALILNGGGGTLPVVVNVPDYSAAKNISTLLRRQGTGSIDRVIITGSSTSFMGGLPVLMEMLKVNEIILPTRRSKIFQEVLKTAMDQDIKVSSPESDSSGRFSYQSRRVKSFYENNRLAVEYLRGGFNIKVSVELAADGSRNLRFTPPGGGRLVKLPIERTDRITVKNFLF